MRLLSNLLSKFVQNGTLRLYDAGGRLHVFGGAGEGPVVTARLSDPALASRLARNPELYAAEAYMDGTLTFEEGSSCYDFLYLFSVNRGGLGGQASQKLLRAAWRGLRRWQQRNPVGGAARNVQHHYDLSGDLYRLFLDEDLNYSCAYFLDPENDSLEAAQQNKLRHATAKLRLKPGMRVAEIGSGWGSFALYLARHTGAHVTAVNVSKEQLAVSRQRAKDEGLEDLVEFRELDYRELTGSYDRVVSVGMMEHVGVGHFDEYFGKVAQLLKDDGYAFIHCIGRMTPPGTTSPFIRKYIFPGGYVPALSETFAATERVGLWVADMEVLRLHYYYTIKHWRERFQANWAAAEKLYDARFCRMWEFYLIAVEMGFLHGSNMVFQLLLSKTRDAVPITRDFITDDERILAARAIEPPKRPRGSGTTKGAKRRRSGSAVKRIAKSSA